MTKKISESNYSDNLFFTLSDGSEVTKEKVVETAKKYRNSYKIIGSLLVVSLFCVTLGLVINLVSEADVMYFLPLVIIDILLLIGTVIFFYKYKKQDLIKFGLEILNYKVSVRLEAEKNADDYNEIEADQIISFCPKERNFIFINSQTKKWQFKKKKFLSDVFSISDILNYEIIENNSKIYEKENSSHVFKNIETLSIHLESLDTSQSRLRITLSIKNYLKKEVVFRCSKHLEVVHFINALLL